MTLTSDAQTSVIFKCSQYLETPTMSPPRQWMMGRGLSTSQPLASAVCHTTANFAKRPSPSIREGLLSRRSASTTSRSRLSGQSSPSR